MKQASKQASTIVGGVVAAAWRWASRAGDVVGALVCMALAGIVSCGDTSPNIADAAVADTAFVEQTIGRLDTFRRVLAQAAPIERTKDRFIVAGRAAVVASAPLTAAGALRLEAAPGLWLELAPEGRRDVPGVLGGLVVYPAAEPATDVAVALGPRGLEQFRILYSDAAPTFARYALTTGPEVGRITVERDRVVVFDVSGKVAFKTLPAIAVDATGRERALSLTYAARHLTVSVDAEGLVYPIVVDPSWTLAGGFPAESVAALNSIELEAHAHVEGAVAVLDRAPGSVLADHVEVALGAHATLDGSLAAARVHLRAHAVVTGDIRADELTGQGTLDGEHVFPVPLPHAIELPDIPAVAPGTVDVRAQRNAVTSLAAGHYRDITLDAGSPPAELRLTGGTYHARDLTLRAHARLTCESACEILLSGRLSAAAHTTIAPLSGSLLDASAVVLFVGGENGGNGQPNASPAAALAAHATLGARIFAPNGTVSVGPHATVTGKLTARDVRVGAHARVLEDDGDNPGTHGAEQGHVDCPNNFLLESADPLGAVIAHGFAETPGFTAGALTLAEQRFLRGASLRARDDGDAVFVVYDDLRLPAGEPDGTTLAPLVAAAARLASASPLGTGDAVAERVTESPADDGNGHPLPIYRTWEIRFRLEGVPVSGAVCSLVAEKTSRSAGLICRLPKGAPGTIEPFTITDEAAATLAVAAAARPGAAIGGRPTTIRYYAIVTDADGLPGSFARARFFVSVYDGDSNIGVLLDGNGDVLESFEQSAFQGDLNDYRVTFNGWDLHYGAPSGYTTLTAPIHRGVLQDEYLDTNPATFQLRDGRANCTPRAADGSVPVVEDAIEPLSLSAGFAICYNDLHRLYRMGPSGFLAESHPRVMPRLSGDYTNIGAYRPDVLALADLNGVLASGMAGAARIPDLQHPAPTIRDGHLSDYLGKSLGGAQSSTEPDNKPWHHAELQAFYNAGELFERYRLFGHPQLCDWLNIRFPSSPDLCSVAAFTTFCPIIGGCGDASPFELQQLLTQDPYRLEMTVHYRRDVDFTNPNFSSGSRAGLNHLHIADHPITEPATDGLAQNVTIEGAATFTFAHEYQHHIMRSLELIHHLEPTRGSPPVEEPRLALDEGLADAFAALMTELEHDVMLSPRDRQPCADPSDYPGNELDNPNRHVCNDVVYDYWQTSPDASTSFGWESHRRGSIVAGALYDFSHRFLDGGFGFALPGTFMYAPIRFLHQRADDEHVYLQALLAHLQQSQHTRRHRGLATVAFEKKRVFPNASVTGSCSTSAAACQLAAASVLAIAGPLNSVAAPSFEAFIPQGPFYEDTARVELATNPSFSATAGEFVALGETPRPPDPPNNSPTGYVRFTFPSSWADVANVAINKDPENPRVYYRLVHCQPGGTRCIRTTSADPASAPFIRVGNTAVVVGGCSVGQAGGGTSGDLVWLSILLAAAALRRRGRAWRYRRAGPAAYLAALLGCSSSAVLDERAVPDGEPVCQNGYDFVDGRCRMREIYFAGGTFTMGRGFCFPVQDHDAAYAKNGTCRFPDEPHLVTLAPFYMDAVEVSDAELHRLHGTGAAAGCAELSVDCVYPQNWATSPMSRDAAEQNCALAGKRLPTEAEWEFAASGGGTRLYPWGDWEPTCDDAGFADCDDRGFAAYPPSPEGVYDLAGAAAEIVTFDPTQGSRGYPDVDWREPYLDPACDNDNFGGEWLCEGLYLRGGSWGSAPFMLRAANRFNRGSGMGFRCVRPAE